MSKVTPLDSTIIEALLRAGECTEFGARFIPKSSDPIFYSYEEVISRAKSAAGTMQAKGLAPGDRVAIILPTSIHFLDAFLGVQLAGGIPAALYPPVRLGRLDAYYKGTRRMVTRIGARFLVTDKRIGKLLGPVVDGTECMKGVFNAETLQGTARWNSVSVDSNSPAFLQFSSGATQDPKAVIVTHTNLIANLEMMSIQFRAGQLRPEAVCWLPLYHDMGLVGCMFTGLYYPSTMNYINPEHFIANPAIWLQTISRFKASISPAPQFAYNLCANKIKDPEMVGVNLSNWVVALNGAEPIDIGGMIKFMDRFSKWGLQKSTLTPVYGLAEAGLAVTFSELLRPPVITEYDRMKLSEEGQAKVDSGIKLVSVGRPLPGLELSICDEQDNPLEDSFVGKVMVKGPSITPGYYNDPKGTKFTIRNGWLDTGDLGFVYDGNLYIVGRSKGLIIIRGRNISPQEIEVILDDIEGVRSGCAVAVSTSIEGKGEQLIILAERDTRKPRPEEELARDIQEKVIAIISVPPYQVQILEPGTLPRTSSGKKRRSDALLKYLSGDLVPPEKMGPLKILQKMGQSQVAWGRYFLKRRSSK